jgi:acyl-CoA thioester hydrolase
MRKTKPLLADDPCLAGTARYSVYYEDTDFSGCVYHANYLKYFERGREDLVGIEHVRRLYERGIHYVVARMDLAFHAPARHGDLIEIATRMRISPSPIGLVEQVASLVPRETDAKPVKLVSATVKLVSIDGSGAATRLPQDVLDYYLVRAGVTTAT